MNRVVLVGRLTKEPEFREFGSGSVTSFTVAVNRNYTNNAGEREADFINCVAFNKSAEFIQKYFHKGNQIGIDGRIQTRSYTGNDGAKKYVTEVICESAHFIEAKGTRSNQESNNGYYNQQTPENAPQQNQYQNSSNKAPAYSNNNPVNRSNQQSSNQGRVNPYNQGPTREEPAFDDIIDDYNISDDDLPF